jgi:predicted aldo/keto reductase-like oxidoreductase
VRISKIFNLYNMGRVYGNWAMAKGDYRSMVPNQWDPEGRQADSCTECGACEKKCPQNIPIRQQLKEAHAALKKE